MAIGVGQAFETESHAPGLWSLRLPRPWAVLGMVLALAYLPHLIAYSANLMQREHYQFFPLAWLGSIVLVWLRRDDLKHRGDVAAPAAGWAGVVLASLMLAAAGILNSSWLAMISVLPMALGLAWLSGGWPVVRVIGPPLVMFATTIRLPGSLDGVLIRGLRSLAVEISSRVLDAIGIIHVPLGNVLRVRGGDLLVDEACSGVNSLVSIMAVVLFAGLLLRRRLPHLILLLAGSAGIVILANVVRVSIVTIAFDRWGIDLLRGWKHEGLGIALYAVSLGLVASLDQLTLLLGSAMPRWSVGTTRTPKARASVLRDSGPTPRRLATCAAILAAVAMIYPIRWAHDALASESDVTKVDHLVGRAREILSESSLPVELAGWRRSGFRTEERSRDSTTGQYSACWEYRLGERTALVSVDYPFLGWHDLTVCYSGLDWTPGQRLVRRGAVEAGSRTPSYIATSLSNRKGGHASLRFGLVDDRDRWVDPPPLRGLGLASREMPWEVAPHRPAYQFQVFCAGYRPQSDEEQSQLTLLFEATSRELERQLFASGVVLP